MQKLIDQVSRAGADHERVAEEVLHNGGLVSPLIEGLQSEQARVKFGCAKVLRLVSERQPELLYPQFDGFVRLLESKNKILQWEAITVLSHLARADKEARFAAIFDQYFAPIPGPVMITAANVIRAAVRIARARTEWADRIAAEVLKVRQARYQTAECRKVAIGHAILALGEFFDLIQDQAAVIKFVRSQRRNARVAVQKKAAVFLKKFAPQYCRK